MKKSSGLGKGLGSLIPDKVPVDSVISPSASPETPSGKVLEVAVESIEVNPHQPRVHFNPSDLEDLIASIKQYGIIQPLVVTKVNNGYQLIAGERRLRASKAVGLEMVPVVVRTATEQEKLELALIENIQRQDLNPVEEARSYKALISSFDLTQEEAAKRLGKSRSSVANAIRLLDLNDEMLNSLAEGEITRSHARALLAQADTTLRNQMYLQMISGDMTVADAEKLATNKRSTKKSVAAPPDPNTLAQQRSLEQIFGTKVRIDKKADGKGSITIDFYSDDELFAILDVMGTIQTV